MPELPEVETVVRDLRPLLSGRMVRRVRNGRKALRVPWRAAWVERVVGRRIEGLRRRGKWILIDLEGGALMLAHLGMTGQLCVVAAGARRETHTHLTFAMDDGHELRFRDVRRFGSIRYCDSQEQVDRLLAEKLGPEPWDLEPEAWYRSLRHSRRALKAILLDQAVVAGVGNIYADEALFVAGLSPRQRGTATTRAHAERLRQAIVRVLDGAIASRGSTIRDYVGGSGLRGEYQQALLVYGRTDQPCPNCRRLIQCTRLGGRSTHYCPQCQRPARSRADR